MGWNLLRSKLPTAEARGLSIELGNQLHSKVPNRIWTTEERVYRHSPTGKTEEGHLVGRTSSLQQGFRGYGETRLTVAVDDQAASAPEQRIVGSVMALPDSTAAGTPLARMPAIDGVQRDSFVEAPLFKVPSESVEGNAHYLTVKPLPLGTEPFEVLDGDVGVIFECKVRDVPYDLPDPIPHKVVFFGLGCF